MNFGDLRAKLSQFELPLSYFTVGETGTSFVCFYNFYDQVLRAKGVIVDLHVALFDRNGKELAIKTWQVEPGDSVQIDLREILIEGEGLVGVMAVPRGEFRKIAAENLVLKEVIGTGYYMIWKDKNFVDQAHEWTAAKTKPSGKQIYYVAFSPSSRPIERGLILMNTFWGTEAPGKTKSVSLKIFDHNAKCVGTYSHEAVPPMGIRTVPLANLFPQLAKSLQDGVVTVEIEGENLTIPLTVEKYADGDFHIHHA